MSKFTSCLNKGFQMEFKNGFRISVQWGIGNYCAVKDKDGWDTPQKQDYWDSTSAEIAVFDGDTRFIDIREDDQVAGWLSTDTVAKVIAIVSSAKTSNEIRKKCHSLNL